MKRYLLNCEPLSPIHIGSGEEINAYEYVIYNKLYKLDLDKLLLALSPEERENILEMLGTNIVAYKKFLINKLIRKDPSLLSEVSSYSILISKAVNDFYQQKSNDPLNLLPVKLFQRNLNEPYFPGSSLKGAIRTAILYNRYHSGLNQLLGKKEKKWELRTNKWEGKVLHSSSPRDDPFRVLKISDSVGSLQTVVLNARVHTLRRGRWEKDKYQILIEAVYNKQPFEAELRLDTELQDYMERLENKSNRLTTEEIVASCRKFYLENFENERKRLSGNKEVLFYSKFYPMMKEIVSNGGELTFPLRLGWGSGFEAITLSLNSSFKELIRMTNQRLARNISSVKLVQDVLPLGWLKVTMKEI